MIGKQLCLIPALFRTAQPWRAVYQGPSTQGASGPTGRGSSEWAAGSVRKLDSLSFLGANPSVNLTIRQHTTLATADRRLQRWQMADMRGDADPAAKQTTIPGNVPTPQ